MGAAMLIVPQGDCNSRFWNVDQRKRRRSFALSLFFGSKRAEYSSGKLFG
jgi:hypothetical protein